MHWNYITDTEAVQDLFKESFEQPLLVFKHSTRCSISGMALSRLERNWTKEGDSLLRTYMVNVIADRPASNRIAEQFQVRHESPQVLIIKDGECIYNESHNAISYSEILSTIQSGK